MANTDRSGPASHAQALDTPEVDGRSVELKQQRSSYRFRGVNWNKANSVWNVQMWDPEAKRNQYVGSYASEEDAARAYDCVAVQARGLGAKRNFSDEAASELAVAGKGERKLLCSSSRFLGVNWNKANSVWNVQMWDPQAKRNQYVGSYASEEDAARAHDCVAVHVHGPGAKRNFPDEIISELPATGDTERKEAQKKRCSSRYIGVTWCKANPSWLAQLYDPQAKRSWRVGYYASEVDAARAYDCAVVQARGPGAKRNFLLDPTLGDPPVSLGEKRKQRSIGNTWS
ncbi:hypothetical protein FOA52_007653 [Chlamydomonas sp. UWO 241]|nr:hypothetical protein FOA52_007653 [Chlamydomonas sp. UWO 241]